MRPKNQAPEVSARADQSERSIEPVRCEVSSGKRRDADWPKVTNQREGHDRDQRDTRSVRLERLVKRNSNFSSFKWNLIELDELFRTI